MNAMTLTRFGLGHVESVETDKPVPGPNDALVKVLACGVCRTDLHLVDGELPNPTIPVVPGHEIVGRIEAVGGEVTTLVPGHASVFRGSVGPAARVTSAEPVARISARTRATRAISSMAGTPNTP